MADQVDETITSLHDAGASDEEITALIKEKFGQPAALFDINKSRAALTLANKQPLPTPPSFGASFIEGLKHPWSADTPESLAALKTQRAAGGPRPDENIIGNQEGQGIAPEDVLMGAQAGSKVVGAVRSGEGLIGKAVAGAREAASQAMPAVKYEVVKSGLTAIGVPAPAASAVALYISGRGGKPKAEVIAKIPPTVAEQLGLAEQPLGATMPQTHDPLSRPAVLHMGDPSLRGPEPVVDRSGPAALLKEQPLFQQQQAMEQHGSQPAAAPVVSPTPVFPQAGGRGDITAPESPEARRMLEEALKKRTAPKTAVALESPQTAAARLGTPPSAQEVASDYAKAHGFPEPVAHDPVKADPVFGKQVADAYAAMKDNPHDPATKTAYAALAKEVSQQFKFIVEKTGLKVEPWTGTGQPYAKSTDMMADVRKNNHLYYFPTEAGFGEAPANSTNPLLAKGASGLPVNDELRVVHDYLAHVKGGHQFGPGGEENAYREHLKLLSPEAGSALATETRGQNSYVNYGPGAHLPPAQRPFAPQKTGLLPPELRSIEPPSPMAIDESALARLPNKRTISNMEIVNEPGGPNASGESGASREALSRLSSMKAKGETFGVLKGGTLRLLIGPEGVDYTPRSGEQYGIIDKDGGFRVLNAGTKTGAPSPTRAKAPVGAGNKALSAEQYAQSLASGETTPEQVSKVLEHERGRRMSVVDRAVFLKAILARAQELGAAQ